MENANIIISRKDINPISKNELESFLSYLGEGYEFDNVVVSVEYLKDIVELALKSFEDKKEHLDYES